MLYRIFGKSGSGKTEIILNKIRECVSSGRQCIVIVPEQQSVAYEREISQRIGAGYNMCCEVLNFERLPNRIARSFGGLTDVYLDKGGRNVIIYSVLCDLRDKLSEYGGLCENGEFVKKIGETLSGMQMHGITAGMLDTALESISYPPLKNKLSDISLILKEYEKRMPEGTLDTNMPLTALAENPKTKDFFKDKYVFIDSCYTYTYQENKIIEIILGSAAEAYITFVADTDEELYGETLLCAQHIKKLCPVCEDIVLGENKRAKDGVIEFLSDNLWSGEDKKYAGSTENVQIISASDKFDEAYAVSGIIHSLIREGYRYGDIAVIMGNASSYDGIADVVFSSDGIPCYMSVKDDIQTKSLVAFVMSAVEVCVTDFAPSSINRYIKNSFCALTAHERDLLTRYADMWNIRGKRWYDGKDWIFNPEGYKEDTKESLYTLKRINCAKEKLLGILGPLRESLTSPDLTVNSGVTALYSLLISAGADKRLLARSQALLQSGKERESDILSQLWNTLIDIFDTITQICGDEKIKAEKLYKYLALMAEQKKVGAIPSYNDSVTVGSASLIRPNNPKICILMGVNDGEFPKSVGANTLFDRKESEELEKAGIDLYLPYFRAQNQERFYFTLAAACPSERLYITYSRGDLSGSSLKPSVAIMRIKDMLGIQEKVFGEKEEDMLYCIQSAARHRGGIKNPYTKKTVEKLCGTSEDSSLCRKDAFVDMDTDCIRLTPSRTDMYASCPFSFFARYLLKLREGGTADFSAPEIGTFIHDVLEKFVSENTKDGVFVSPSEEDAKNQVDTLTEKYILSVVKENAADGRFVYALNKFKKTLYMLTKSISDEFEQSKFNPRDFELRIGGDTLPEITVPTEKGEIKLYGIIDRTDTYTDETGKTYLRVVDYKTGKKRFSLKKIEKGIDLQMLMYLFTCCDGDKSGNTYPAGVLYMPAYAPQLDEKKTHENPDEDALKGFKKNGLVLSDPEIIRAMEKEGAGVYIPVSITKDGEINGKTAVNAVTLEEFGVLREQLTQTVKDMGTRLLEGNMCINPVKQDGIDACLYCKYKSLCRNM